MNMKILTVLLLSSVVMIVSGVNVKGIMIVGFGQSKCDESFEGFLSRGFGGIVFFTHNMKDEKEIECMTRKAKSSGVKVIAVDHEGTYINRFRYIDGFIPPNAMAIGSTNDERLAYLSGYYSALTLRRLGFNVDFAPVLDVNSNPMNPVIGVRSFWSDPQRVARLGRAFMEGLLDGGVLPVVKHFPGHGDTDTDSHTGLPVVNKNLEDLVKSDLIPFEDAIAHGAPAVMTAHIIVRGWDGFPATLSKRILDYLRNDMGFDGIVISDDMLMRAVWIFSNLKGLNPAVEAVKAGVDLLIVSKSETAEEFSKSIEEALESGKIAPEKIETSLERVEDILKSLKVKPPRYDMEPEEVLRETAERSIAAWNGKPIKSGKYALLYPTGFRATPKDYTESVERLCENLERMGIGISSIPYNVRSPSVYLRPDLYDGVIILSVDLHRYHKASDFVDSVLRDFNRSVLVAIRSPYDLLALSSKPGRYVVTYDWNAYYPDPLSGILTGEREAVGEFVSKDLLGGM